MFKSVRFAVALLGATFLVSICPGIFADEPKPADNPTPPTAKLNITETSLGTFEDGGVVDSPAVSPDSTRTAYCARHGDKWITVTDGVEGKEYDSFGKETLVFSPDSKRVAYSAMRGEKWLMVIDGVDGREYDEAGMDVFSPDSKHIAYGALRGEKYFIVVDGKEGREYDEILEFPLFPLVFSPDSQRIAYIARRESKAFVVVNATECGEYDGFVKGSRILFDSPDKLHTLMERGGEIFLVEIEITN